jgi:hypothetical protein
LDTLGMGCCTGLRILQHPVKNLSTSKTRTSAHHLYRPVHGLVILQTHIHYTFLNKTQRSDRENTLRMSRVQQGLKIPESNEDPVFVLAQNSADIPEIDAKNSTSNTDNEVVDRIMGNDTIESKTPSTPRLARALSVDENRSCSYLL